VLRLLCLTLDLGELLLRQLLGRPHAVVVVSQVCKVLGAGTQALLLVPYLQQ
jgi:hypothetical protein